MHKCEYFTRYYYSLNDLLEATSLTSQTKVNYILGKAFNRSENVKEFAYIINTFINTSLSANDELNSDIANILWCEYFVPYYKKECILFVDNSEVDSETKKEFIEWLSMYIAIFRRTYNKYKTLIDLYQTQKTNLLNKIQSISSIAKSHSNTIVDDGTTTNNLVQSTQVANSEKEISNDTPQDDGTYEDATHQSFVRKGNSSGSTQVNDTGTVDSDLTRTENGQSLDTITNTDDRDTLMARLNEINVLWQDIYTQWTKEFKHLFIESWEE